MNIQMHSVSGRVCALMALMAAVFVATRASAEIFRCEAKNGLPLYQNFPCQFDSLGSMATVGRIDLVLPAALPARVPAADAEEPLAGMSQTAIRALLGEPLEIMPDESNALSTELWRYPDKGIRFDRARRVVSIDKVL
jgi:hypothetical protein